MCVALVATMINQKEIVYSRMNNYLFIMQERVTGECFSSGSMLSFKNIVHLS